MAFKSYLRSKRCHSGASENCQKDRGGLAIIIYNLRRTLPRVRALYDYEAADVDEISIREGDVFELVQEREYLNIYVDKQYLQNIYLTDETGWWTGKNNGKEGFFPGNYVEKI